jgi:hypothetical protein
MRVQRLKDEQRARPDAEAIANLIALPPRQDWWHLKTRYTEPLVHWQDAPPIPQAPRRSRLTLAYDPFAQ